MQFLHLINTRQYYLKIIISASFQSGLELELGGRARAAWRQDKENFASAKIFVF